MRFVVSATKNVKKFTKLEKKAKGAPWVAYFKIYW